MQLIFIFLALLLAFGCSSAQEVSFKADLSSSNSVTDTQPVTSSEPASVQSEISKVTAKPKPSSTSKTLALDFTIDAEEVAKSSTIALFLDDSGSMQASFETLSQSIPSTLSSIFDDETGTVRSDVRLYIVPQSARSSNSYTYSPTIDGQRSQNLPSGQAEFYRFVEYSLAIDNSAASNVWSYDFSAGMNQQEFDQVNQEIIAKMLDLVSQAKGNGNEVLLSHAARFLDALGDRSSTLATLFLTDEDDNSTSSVYKQITQKFGPKTYTASEVCNDADGQCDSYRAIVRYKRGALTYNQKNGDDKTSSFSFRRECLEDGELCPETSGSVSCSAKQESKINGDYEIENCSYRYYESSTYVASTVIPLGECEVAFTYQGVDYSNAMDYVKRQLGYVPLSCSTSATNFVQKTISSYSNYDVKSLFNDAPYKSLANTLGAMFYKSDYFVTSIFRDPNLDSKSSGCPVDNYFENGAEFSNLTSYLGSNGYSASTCESSYKPALEPLKNFVSRSVNNCHPVDYDMTQLSVSEVSVDGVVLNANDYEVIDNSSIPSVESEICVAKDKLSLTNQNKITINLVSK